MPSFTPIQRYSLANVQSAEEHSTDIHSKMWPAESGDGASRVNRGAWDPYKSAPATHESSVYRQQSLLQPANSQDFQYQYGFPIEAGRGRPVPAARPAFPHYQSPGRLTHQAHGGGGQGYGGGVQGQATSRPSTLYPAARKGREGYYRQAQQNQQYADPYYQPYQYDAAVAQVSQHFLLTQQWAGFNANAPSFTPVNDARYTASSNLKSVWAAKTMKKYSVDKKSRHNLAQQQRRIVNQPPEKGGFDTILHDSSFVDTTPKKGRNIQQTQIDTPVSRRSGSPKTPNLNLIPKPNPSPAYLIRAKQEPLIVGEPRQLLVVLDLNGTLLFRKSRSGNNILTRPRVFEFLHYLISNHKVLVWSSAQPANVENMCQKLFSPDQKAKLVGIWGRDKLRLSDEHYKQKVQVYKQLSWVWSDPAIAASAPSSCAGWDQENTVLIDDSVEKGASEPYSIVKIDEFEGKPEQTENDVLGQVVAYLQRLRWQRNASAYMRKYPFVFDENVVFDWMPTIEDMQ